MTTSIKRSRARHLQTCEVSIATKNSINTSGLKALLEVLYKKVDLALDGALLGKCLINLLSI